MTSATEIKLEQGHFDTAWDARERKRANLKAAPGAAAGPNKTVGAVRKAVERELEKLGGPDDAVAFGRFDLAEESLYVGTHLISTDDRDLLVINWQADAAAPFYKATFRDPCGVRLKRQFSTKRNEVVDFDETAFADLASRVEELTGPVQWGVDDAVLRDLDAGRTGAMRDIVQTIHAAQYELIRSPLDRLLVIQGGPGTGKTAVALHRISWLLYNNQQTMSADDFLVIGPNPTFTRYIKSVLPGLGDANVHYRDLRSLGPQSSHGQEDVPEAEHLKGETRMAAMLHAGLIQRIRFPERTEVLEVGTEVGAPSFTREEIQVELPRHIGRSTYNAGRGSFRTYLADEASKRTRRSTTVTAIAVDNALERVWPSLTPQACLRDLLGSRDRLLTAAGETFTAADVTRLLRPSADRLADEPWSAADVALLDELDELINGKPSGYGHIVVDEAQDLSPMQLRSIQRRSRDGSMTIVGDLAQSTGAWARDSWDEIVTALAMDRPTELKELTLGYRVPQQIFSFAAQLLPYAAPELTAPRVVRLGPADPELIEVDSGDIARQAVKAASAHAGSGRFVGVICPDHLRNEVENELRRRDVSWGNVGAGELDKSINLARPVEAKGLEFDAVVVLDPAAVVQESERGYRMLYVALTRTTKYLTVIHTGVAMPIPSGEPIPDAVIDRSAIHTVDEPPESDFDIASTESSLPPLDVGVHRPRTSTAKSVEAHPGKVSAPDLGQIMVQAAAASVAHQIRTSVSPDVWALLIDQLRRELGVSQEDVFDHFD